MTNDKDKDKDRELIERLACLVSTSSTIADEDRIQLCTRFLSAYLAERGKEAVAWIDAERPSRVISSPYKPEENDSGWLPLFLAPQPAIPEGMALVSTEIIDRFPEINPSNYDHDGVCALNAWGVELVLSIDAAAGSQP